MENPFKAGSAYRLALAWLAAVCIVAVMILQQGSFESGFLGIADADEVTVAAEKASFLRSLHVKPGQKVEKDELIAVLDQPELDAAISNLRHQMKILQAEAKINLGLMEPSASGPAHPLLLQIDSIKDQLHFLVAEKERLRIHAKRPGVVGSILFREGDLISPFQPVLTLYSEQATLIKGYVHESLPVPLREGDPVAVTSLARSDLRDNGRILYLGKKLMPFPLPIQGPNAVEPSWGREAIVQLSESSGFYPGERVLVIPQRERSPFRQLMDRSQSLMGF